MSTKKEWIRTLKFALFSLSAGIIQIIGYTVFLEVFKIRPWISYLGSLVLSVLWNFTLNRKFTFHSASNIPIAMLKTFGYYLVFTPLSTLWTAVLTERFLWNEYLVQILTMLTNLSTEYLFQRFFVYPKSLDTIAKAQSKD